MKLGTEDSREAELPTEEEFAEYLAEIDPDCHRFTGSYSMNMALDIDDTIKDTPEDMS